MKYEKLITELKKMIKIPPLTERELREAEVIKKVIEILEGMEWMKRKQDSELNGNPSWKDNGA